MLLKCYVVQIATGIPKKFVQWKTSFCRFKPSFCRFKPV